jgi:hypothetical protein
MKYRRHGKLRVENNLAFLVYVQVFLSFFNRDQRNGGALFPLQVTSSRLIRTKVKIPDRFRMVN